MNVDTEISAAPATARGRVWPQALSALAVDIGALIIGIVISWPTMALPQLRYDETLPKLEENQLSMLAALTPIGGVIASFPAGFSMDFIGSRRTMLAVTPAVIAGWLLLYFSSSFAMLLAGRTITSLAFGVYQLGGSIFISEIADARIRGALVSSFFLMCCVGSLLISVIGAFVTWRDMSLICASFPAIFLLSVALVPDSPRFLVSKGKIDEAAKSMMKLRRLPLEAVQPEVETLKQALKIHGHESDDTKTSKYTQILEPSVLKSLGKCLVILLLQVLSGIGPITAFAIDIFERAGTGIDSYVANIIVTSAQVIASFVSIAFVDKLGRKALLMTSAALVGLSNAALGVFFYAQGHNIASFEDYWHVFRWLPLVGVMGVMGGYSIGIGPVPNSILPELLPQHVRGVASSITRVGRAITSFLVTLYFKDFIKYFGPGSSYWAFAACCVGGIVFVWLAIPETKGRSLEEIQKSLHNKVDGAAAAESK